jgi:multiple RNA-binding domain-containing protein 1
MDGSHRGFAFVQYDNVEDAVLAKEALANTHLYGRKLIVDYEKGVSTKKMGQ